LFLYFSPIAPHDPAVPAARHQGAFGRVHVARDPAFGERDVSDKPAYVRRGGVLTGAGAARMDEHHRRRLRTLLAADEAIARVWQELARTGRLDNSYVFVLSDNGYLLGQHNWAGKGVPYDGSVRVPMLAYGPGFSAGATDRRLVASIDLAPTIAALAGAAPRHRMDGVPLLGGGDRDAVLLEFPHSHSLVNLPPWRAVRTADQLYVEYGTGECELYDHATDPHELRNLLAGGGEEPPDLAARLAELSGIPSSGCPKATGTAKTSTAASAAAEPAAPMATPGSGEDSPAGVEPAGDDGSQQPRDDRGDPECPRADQRRGRCTPDAPG
jgi:arylsulfatase A-like enzyme